MQPDFIRLGMPLRTFSNPCHRPCLAKSPIAISDENGVVY